MSRPTLAAVGGLDPHGQEAGRLVLHADPGRAQRPADPPQLGGHLGRCLALAEEAQVDVGVVADHSAVAGRAEQGAEGDPALDAALSRITVRTRGSRRRGRRRRRPRGAGERPLDQPPLVDEDRDAVQVDEARPALAAAEHHGAFEEHVVTGDDPDLGGAVEQPSQPLGPRHRAHGAVLVGGEGPDPVVVHEDVEGAGERLTEVQALVVDPHRTTRRARPDEPHVLSSPDRVRYVARPVASAGCSESRRLPGPEPGRHHGVVGGAAHLGGASIKEPEKAQRAEDPVDPGAGWQDAVSAVVAATVGGLATRSCQ